MAAPLPLRLDFSAADLRGHARRTRDASQARRLLALAAIYDGGSRSNAARIGGVGLQIVRDWAEAALPTPGPLGRDVRDCALALDLLSKSIGVVCAIGHHQG